jgi:predicted O-methyltransferase YrrM
VTVRTERDWEGEELTVDGVTFVCRPDRRFESTERHFDLIKRPDLVEHHLALLRELEPRRIVELGVFQGGSVALTALVAEPEVLVAFELSEKRIGALDALLAERGLGDRVHVHHGVDQADEVAIVRHLAEAGLADGRTIDLVVDDASHLVHETRRSFEILYPRLRPGAKYVVEDWAWAHIGYGSAHPDQRPLSELVFEVAFASAFRPDVVRDVHVDRDWAVVTRGPADLPLDGSFRIADHYNERSRTMLPP